MVQLRSLIFLSLFSSAASTAVLAQQVAVSKEFNIRTDYAYEILGHIEDNILLYRDKGFDKMISAFDNDLQFKWENKIYFEHKKVKVIGLTPRDSVFSIFYAMKKDGVEYLRVGNYDGGARLRDSLTVIEQERDLVGQQFEIINSEDKKKSLLYFTDHNDRFKVIVYDHVKDTLDWEEDFYFEGIDINDDLFDIQFTNTGEVVLLLEKDSRMGKDDKGVLEFIVFSKYNRSGSIGQIHYNNKYLQDIKMSIDEENSRIGFFGLYNDKKAKWADGYFYQFIDWNKLANQYEFEFKAFSPELIVDVYGPNAKKKKGLNFFLINDVFWRKDGGLIMIMEMQRQFSRRNNYDIIGRSSADYYSSRGWVDYFSEDMVIMALHPDGSEHWTEVLFKKQFSQDDGGIYASYYPFITPSRLRLIYNDEIKKENTVSEYVLNGIGEYKRESLFSTRYQNIKLRLMDALQISNNEILIPSQKNYNLSLVKISYN